MVDLMRVIAIAIAGLVDRQGPVISHDVVMMLGMVV
jgi:hypothetical protein